MVAAVSPFLNHPAKKGESARPFLFGALSVVNDFAIRCKRLISNPRRFRMLKEPPLHTPHLVVIPFVSRAGSSYAEEYSRGEECANEERFDVDVFHMPPRYSPEPE